MMIMSFLHEQMSLCENENLVHLKSAYKEKTIFSPDLKLDTFLLILEIRHAPQIVCQMLVLRRLLMRTSLYLLRLGLMIQPPLVLKIRPGLRTYLPHLFLLEGVSMYQRVIIPTI